jgi:hypothetical protein
MYLNIIIALGVTSCGRGEIFLGFGVTCWIRNEAQSVMNQSILLDTLKQAT